MIDFDNLLHLIYINFLIIQFWKGFLHANTLYAFCYIS